MDVKQVATVAKKWVENVLAEEQVFNVGLEEIEYSPEMKEWRVTVGFSRPWNTARNALTAITGEQSARRAYRVITVREPNGEVTSMKRRNAQEIDG
jgi:hypothetical protein